MPQKVFGLTILFTTLFILGINPRELNYLLNLGNPVCLACIGVGG